MAGKKMKPCPFCGGMPEFREAFYGLGQFKRYALVCRKCLICIGWEESVEEVVARWNHREGALTDDKFCADGERADALTRGAKMDGGDT